MLTGLLSFLGGNVFRLVFGELISFLNKKQEHSQELDRMQLQGTLDKETHARNMEAITIQAQLGVKTIQVQAESAISQTEAEGWLSVVNATSKIVGIAFIDGWNAAIRPAVATWAVVMMTLSEFAIITLSENSIAVCGVALGIYFATRDLFKQGKR